MLTTQNYFTKENKYLTNSKVGDYLLQPNYFYRKHILGEIESEPTKAMVFGSAVDFLLAQDDDKPVFKVVARRNLKNPPEDCIEVNQSDYDEIMAVATVVSETEVFKDIDKNFKKNPILFVDKKIGKHFVGIAGRPDYLKVEDKGDYLDVVIGDLKTARTSDKRKYYYHCLDFGYYRQQAFYQMIIEWQNPTRKIKFKSSHLVVDKIREVYNAKLYRLDQEIIEEEKIKLFNLITEISERKDYSRPAISWGDEELLTDPRIDEEFYEGEQ